VTLLLSLETLESYRRKQGHDKRIDDNWINKVRLYTMRSKQHFSSKTVNMGGEIKIVFTTNRRIFWRT